MSIFDQINNSIANGRFTVGISGATEPGLPVDRYIRIPERMIKPFTYTDATGATKVVPAATLINEFFHPVDLTSGTRRMKKGTPVFVSRRAPGLGPAADKTAAQITAARNAPIYHYKGAPITNIVQPNILQADVEEFYDQNLPLYNDKGQGWDISFLATWMSARLITVIMNLISPYGEGEFVLVPTPAAYVPSAAATLYANNPGVHFSNGKLLIAGGITNWYLLNHTTGQGQLVTAARKVTQIISYPFPSGPGAANIGGRKKALAWYYDACHAADKRNGVHSTIEYSANICGAYVPGLPIGLLADPDDFIKIRAYGRPIPAGHHKQSDTDIAAKLAARSGVLPFAPGFEAYASLRKDLAEISNLMGVAHQGADFLLRDDPDGYTRQGASQNDNKYTYLYESMGIYVDLVMHNSTLADAPLFRNAANNRGTAHPAWTALCTAYSQSATATPDPALVEAIKKESGVVTSAGLIQTLQQNAAAIPATETANIEHAKRVIAAVATRIGKHYAGLEQWGPMPVVVGGNAAFTTAANAAITAFTPT